MQSSDIATSGYPVLSQSSLLASGAGIVLVVLAISVFAALELGPEDALSLEEETRRDEAAAKDSVSPSAAVDGEGVTAKDVV